MSDFDDFMAHNYGFFLAAFSVVASLTLLYRCTPGRTSNEVRPLYSDNNDGVDEEKRGGEKIYSPVASRGGSFALLFNQLPCSANIAAPLVPLSVVMELRQTIQQAYQEGRRSSIATLPEYCAQFVNSEETDQHKSLKLPTLERCVEAG